MFLVVMVVMVVGGRGGCGGASVAVNRKIQNTCIKPIKQRIFLLCEKHYCSHMCHTQRIKRLVSINWKIMLLYAKK